MVPYGNFDNSGGGPTQYDANITLPIDFNRKREKRLIFFKALPRHGGGVAAAAAAAAAAPSGPPGLASARTIAIWVPVSGMP